MSKSYIAILQDGHFCSQANNLRDFLRMIVAEKACHDKYFDILLESNKLTLDELIQYANQHLLIMDDEITEIFVLGEKVYEEGNGRIKDSD